MSLEFDPVIHESDINMAFYRLCLKSIYWPVEERRNGDKLHDSPYPIYVCITHPQRRVLNIPYRNNDIAAQCAETLWVLAGRNDIEFLSRYLPRAKDFSDDGKTWRAGYGPRLRNFYPGGEHWTGNDTVLQSDNIDQVKFVVNELKLNQNSRRAVIGLFDPKADVWALHETKEGTKDFPCTQSLSFMVRDGKLDLTVFIRSNDLIWGWSGVNVFEFTVLQEVVAGMLDLPVGAYYMISNNLHVYERHWKLVDNIAKELHPHIPESVYKSWSGPRYQKLPTVERMDYGLRKFFEAEESLAIRGSLEFHNTLMLDMSFADSLLGDLVNVVLARAAFTRGEFNLSAQIRGKIKDLTLRESHDRSIARLQRSVPRTSTD